MCISGISAFGKFIPNNVLTEFHNAAYDKIHHAAEGGGETLAACSTGVWFNIILSEDAVYPMYAVSLFF